MRSFVFSILYNVAIVAFVFLPIFILAGWLEAFLIDKESTGTLLETLSSMIALFLVMIIPLLVTSVVHSIMIHFIPRAWSRRQRRILAVLLALIVPGGLLLLQIPLGYFFLVVPVSTIVAVITYGTCVRI